MVNNDNAAVVAWKMAFEVARDALIASEQFYNAEHIRNICGDPPIEAHHNIFGGMCSNLWRLSNIISNGQCTRPSSHARGLRVYKGAKREE